jgi:predicted oxidoreductase
MWRFAGTDIATARAKVIAAFEAGITLFDTADIYGFDGKGGFGDAESLLGDVLRSAPEVRGKMVLATKGGITPPVPYDSSADYLHLAIDRSLRRMGVESVELYQIHRPDILTHPQEVARTLEDAVRAGKIGHIGVSNYTPQQITALQSFLGQPIVSTQPEISPLRITCIENGELDQAMVMDMAVLAWSPLGGGRIGEPQTPREIAVANALDTVASAQGVSRTAAAYSWIMTHPARPIPIIGTQSPERIKDTAEAYKVRWTREDWYAVLVASRGERLP